MASRRVTKPSGSNVGGDLAALQTVFGFGAVGDVVATTLAAIGKLVLAKVLCVHSLLEHTDVTIMYDNEALYDICRRILAVRLFQFTCLLGPESQLQDLSSSVPMQP